MLRKPKKSRRLRGYITTHKIGYGGGAGMLPIGEGATSSDSSVSNIITSPAKKVVAIRPADLQKELLSPVVKIGLVAGGAFILGKLLK